MLKIKIFVEERNFGRLPIYEKRVCNYTVKSIYYTKKSIYFYTVLPLCI